MASDAQPAPSASPKYARQPNETGTSDALKEIERLAARSSCDPVHHVEHVEVLLMEWEHIVDRATDPCPCCETVVELDAMIPHLLACSSHPGHREAERVEAAIAADPLAGVRAEVERFASALAGLVNANATYWARMRDGDGGRSIEDPAQVPQWEAARKAARRVLVESGCLEASP